MVNNNDILLKINNFSHAYLIDSNNLDYSYDFVKELSKRIIFSTNDEKLYSNDEISLLIDNNDFDDYYVLNPDNINIKVDDINELLDYFETKSLRNNGNRVYVIYGLERLRPILANKLLKFIEEPENNIYGILMTQNVDTILPTIVSRCQVIKLRYDVVFDNEKINNMKEFIKCYLDNKIDTIAYENDYWAIYDNNRKDYFECFSIIELLLSSYINKFYSVSYDEKYIIKDLSNIDINKIIKMLNITSKLKGLINNNINLNLLIDRYIIEMERGD